MSFKFPGSDVAFVTGFWILLAVVVTGAGIKAGVFPWYFIAVALIGVSAVGMWFQLRPAGYIFSGLLAFLAVIGVVGLVSVGFSVDRLARVVGNVFSSWIAFEWCRNRREDA